MWSELIGDLDAAGCTTRQLQKRDQVRGWGKREVNKHTEDCIREARGPRSSP